MASRLPVRGIASPGADSGRRGLRILIADDDRDAALALATGLREANHEVDVVLRAGEILNVERLLRPDALILAAGMAGANASAIARKIREKHRQIAPLLIEICGAWTDPAQRWFYEDEGFDHHLLRSCDPHELVRLLERYGSRSDTKAFVPLA